MMHRHPSWDSAADVTGCCRCTGRASEDRKRIQWQVMHSDVSWNVLDVERVSAQVEHQRDVWAKVRCSWMVWFFGQKSRERNTFPLKFWVSIFEHAKKQAQIDCLIENGTFQHFAECSTAAGRPSPDAEELSNQRLEDPDTWHLYVACGCIWCIFIASYDSICLNRLYILHSTYWVPGST